MQIHRPSLTFEVTDVEDLGLSGTSDGEYLVGIVSWAVWMGFFFHL